MRSLYATSLALLATSCYDDSVYDDLVALTASRDTSSTGALDPSASSSGGETSPGDSSGASSTSATGPSSGTDGGGEGEGTIEPRVFLEVSPTALEVAGPLVFAVEHSSEVERLALFEGESDEPTLEWLAGDPPPPLLVTRGEFTEVRTFTVRGYDADDNFGVSNPAAVQLLLPAPGTLLWEKTFEVGSQGWGRAVASRLINDEPKIILGFEHETDARVGRYTPEGDPELIAPASSAPTSTVAGIALSSEGDILAVGNETVDDESRPWLAQIDPHTAAVNHLFKGKAGEVATGLALDLETGRIYISGHSPDKELARPDARVWALSASGELLWTRLWERPIAQKFLGQPLDVALGVAVLENGDPVLVGESSWQPPGDPPPPVATWAFANRYNPNGTLDDTKSWTSENALYEAGARAVVPDRDNGLLVAGWSRVVEGAPRQATVFGFGEFLVAAELYTAKATHRHTAQGVARLPTGDLVLAMDVDNTDDGVYTAEFRGVEGLFDPPPWSHAFGGDGQIGRVGQMSLTSDAHVLVVGTRATAGVNTMFLAALHP